MPQLNAQQQEFYNQLVAKGNTPESARSEAEKLVGIYQGQNLFYNPEGDSGYYLQGYGGTTVYNNEVPAGALFYDTPPADFNIRGTGVKVSAADAPVNKPLGSYIDPSQTDTTAAYNTTDPTMSSWVNPQTSKGYTATDTSGAAGSGGAAADGSSNTSQTSQMTDQQFESWLNSQNLTPDQKAAVRALYTAVGTNDQATADKVKAAIAAGTAYSDPYFKAQSKLLVDALDRGMSNIEGDLAYNEKSLSDRLKDIRETIARSGEYLSFQHMQELKDLERKFSQDLQVTQEDMAARGFTSSSVRTKKEDILSDTYGDMRESSNRAFQYQTANNQAQLTSAERDTAAEVARLRDLAARGKLDLLRGAEQDLGSTALGNLGYDGLLGGIGGELPRQQAQDALSFASSYVF